MASDQSWTPKGLKPETLAALREAARRQGTSVGQWLDAALSELATQDTAPTSAASGSRRRKAAPAASGETRGKSGTASRDRLDELAWQLDQAAHAPAPPHAPAPAKRSSRAAPPADDLSATLRAIEKRLAALGGEDAARPKHRHPVAPVERARGPLRSRIEHRPVRPVAADNLPPHRQVEPDDTDVGFEEPDHHDAPPSWLDTPPVKAAPAPAIDTAALQAQLQTLTDELRQMRDRNSVEHILDVLREELTGISHKLDEAAPRRDLQALQAEVRALADRIEDSHQPGLDAPDGAELRTALAGIRETLQQFTPAEMLAEFRHEVRTLDRKIDSLATGAGDPRTQTVALDSLAGSIAELREITAHAATGDALVALAEEIQVIRERVDGLTASSGTANTHFTDLIDSRFRELEERLAAHGQGIEAVPGHIAKIVDQLAQRLDDVNVRQDSSPLLDSIAGQVSQLTDQIAATHSRMDSLNQFERGFRELLGGMAELRASTLDAAQQVARDAATEAIGEAQSTDMLGLTGDLDALRRNQETSDRRTQDTLEAVHDTLERLVDRLALVETRTHRPAGVREAQQPQPPASVDEPVFVPASPVSAAPPLQPSPEPAPRPAVAEAPLVRPPAPAERQPIDPTLPADHPLEPGAVAARTKPAASAAERIAASEAALGSAAPPLPEANAKANFIAAARRAAQAAANMAPPVTEPAASEEKRGTSTFSALAQRFTGRRSLMLALLLLVSGGAMHMLLSNSEPRRAATPAPTVNASRPAPAPVAAPAVANVFTPQPMTSPAPLQPRSTPAASAAAPNPLPVSEASRPTAAAPEHADAGARREETAAAPVNPLSSFASMQIPGRDFTASVSPASGAAPHTGYRPPSADDTSALPASFSARLRDAAQAGDPTAEYEVAIRFAEGRGVPLNYESAIRWFERAANRKLAPAQYRLGSLYEKGHGTRKNLDQARRLYQAAAEQGNGKAMHNLAVLYAEGIDGKPDLKVAADWFRQAAIRGIGDSQYNLGILYARGLGVEQNLAESFKWFALAAKQGDDDAGKKRDDIVGRLDRQALVAARLAVQTFAPEPQPEEAVTVRTPPGGWDNATAAAPEEKPKARSRAPRRNTPSS